MENPIKTGADLLLDYKWYETFPQFGSMVHEYGVVRESDQYQRIIWFLNNIDDKSVLLCAIEIVEDLAKREDIGGLVNTRKLVGSTRGYIEIWKNITLAKSEERKAV